MTNRYCSTAFGNYRNGKWRVFRNLCLCEYV